MSQNHRILLISNAPASVEHLWQQCSIRGCKAPYLYLTASDYVTGRRGRVSWRKRYLCSGHAERWCIQHGVTLDDVTTPILTRDLRNDHPAFVYAP